MYTTYTLTWVFVIEAVLLLSIPVVLAYVLTRIDIYLIRKRIQREQEQRRIMDVLKRSE